VVVEKETGLYSSLLGEGTSVVYLKALFNAQFEDRTVPPWVLLGF
jgi:hypothetical protein